MNVEDIDLGTLVFRRSPVGSAIYSRDEKYRYLLTRHIGGANGRVVWVMLNPSTAGHEEDDPTIRRVMSFSRRLGATDAWVVNVFALRATDPMRLVETTDDPIGEHNRYVWKSAFEDATWIVAAWGKGPKSRKGVNGCFVTTELRGTHQRLTMPNALTLGKNKDGSPKHPLYLADDTPLVAYHA